MTARTIKIAGITVAIGTILSILFVRASIENHERSEARMKESGERLNEVRAIVDRAARRR